MANHSALFSKAAVDSKKVWATLITNVYYLPGLLMLDFSLKKAGSKYPLVVIYTDAFEEEGHKALDARGIPKQHVSYLKPSVDRDYTNDPRFIDTWTKLACFSLTQYDRVVLLDSDMLVLQNMDELMDLPLDPASMGGKGQRVFAASHACSCNPYKKPHYPAHWTRENCAFTTNESDPDKAQIEGAPANAGIGMVNSGLVVLVPSESTFQQILDKLQEPEAIASYIFPDQALISDVFRDRWVALPYIYNALRSLREPDVHGIFWRDDRVKNIHFIIHPKPWDLKPEEAPNKLYTRWWKENQLRIEEEKSKGIQP